MNTGPRIALLGIVLESNSFAPVATETAFRSRYYFQGDAIVEQARNKHSVIPVEMSTFVRTMDALRPWHPVPVILTGCQPAGPVDQAFLDATLDNICTQLQTAGRIDGVYVAAHGGMTATDDSDPDGEILARIRDTVGQDATLIATLDLHGNISQRMVESADVLISYLTNPHVDMVQRGEEAAHHMCTLLSGVAAHAKFIRLPLTPPSVTLLTEKGPYAELIDYGQRRQREYGGDILNVSVLGGFVYSDTPKNGLAVIVTSRQNLEPAEELAREIATLAWSQRQRFTRTLCSIDTAVQRACQTAQDETLPALIYSDAGDNPGGGGGGNTIWLLKALVAARAKKILYGSFVDPELATEAHRLGENIEFNAVFNRNGNSEFAQIFSTPARIHRIGDGRITGRRGIFANRLLELGPSCVLEIGGVNGILAVIISNRQQTADPMFFEQFGLNVDQARIVCVKSRGHFRAGFDEWFTSDQVLEVDTPGLTSPVLDRFQWRGLPRPVYPLDPETRWHAP